MTGPNPWNRSLDETGPLATLLIIGGSRGIGLEAVKLGLARGHTVRALSRGADRIAISDPSLDKRSGDALESADVAAALEGVDVVIQALGVSAGPDMVLRPVHLFSAATRVLIPAMEQAGVRRLISVTGYGAGDSRATLGCLQGTVFRLVLGRAYDDKDVQERLIKASELDWIIARPAILTKGAWSGRYRVLVEPGTWRNGFISRADVADFLIGQVEDDTYLRRTPVLAY